MVTMAPERGVRGDYTWIDTGVGPVTATLAEAVPELFVGRILLAVAVDGEPYMPQPAERRAGWVARVGDLRTDPSLDERGWSLPTFVSSTAVSPTIKSLSQMRGYLKATCEKECYTLPPGTNVPSESWATIERYSTITGIEGAFPACICAEEDIGDDETMRYFHRMVERFWNQIEVLQAESYIYDRGGSCVLVSRNPRLVDEVARLVRL